MRRQLREIVDRVLAGGGMRRNLTLRDRAASLLPGETSPDYRLQVELVNTGLKDKITEAEAIEAAMEVGVPEEDIPGWIEDLASWI